MWMNKRVQDRIEQAKKTDIYWVERAKLDFALEINRMRQAAGINSKTLAERIGASAAYISKVFRGDSNLTIESMVKLARATDSKLEIKLVNHVSQAKIDPTFISKLATNKINSRGNVAYLDDFRAIAKRNLVNSNEGMEVVNG